MLLCFNASIDGFRGSKIVVCLVRLLVDLEVGLLDKCLDQDRSFDIYIRKVIKYDENILALIKGCKLFF